MPAPFRNIIMQGDVSQAFCYPALDVLAIEVGGKPLVHKIYKLLEDLPPFSDERDILSTSLFGGSENLKIDSDGRIILPETFRAYAKINDFVSFVGMGDKFRIWSPEIFADYMDEVRQKSAEHRKLFAR